MDSLRLDGVVKRFGDFTAVEDLSFAVAPGEVFGFLGGNGAGKTTSLRPALEPVSSVASVATIIFFFVAGYLMVSMIFLVIGVLSESMRDAQGYLTPVIMVIMIPFTLLLQSILAGKGGILLDVMT